MNGRKVYKNEKAGHIIRESSDHLLKEWNCNIYEFDIKGRYGLTHVIECGTSEMAPLVLFHGVGDDAALMWIYNAKELGEHFHIFAIDTIGGPGKSVPDAGYTSSFEDVIWFEDAGHGINHEKAKEVNQLIIDFFSARESCS